MFDSDQVKLYKTETKRIMKLFIETKKSSLKDFSLESLKKNIIFWGRSLRLQREVLETGIPCLLRIAIIDAFVAMRTNLIEQKYINNMILKHDSQIKLLQKAFNTIETQVVSIFCYISLFLTYFLLEVYYEKTINHLFMFINITN